MAFLKDEEKDALQMLPLTDVWTDALEGMGEPPTTADAGSDDTVN